MTSGLLAVGATYLLALAAGRLAARFSIPRVTGYLLVGIAVGPSTAALLGTPPLVDEALLAGLAPIHDLALALIVFSIGGCFHLDAVRKGGLGLFLSSAAEMGATAALVWGVCRLAGAPFAIASFLAAMAMSTAPAVTRMVAREYESDGPLTDRLMVLIGIDNLGATLAFVVLLHVFVGGAADGGAFRALGAPVAVGLAAGSILAVMDQRIVAAGPRQILVIGVLAALSAGCRVLGVSAMLAGLVAGATVVNASPRRDRLVSDLQDFDYPLYVIFFVTAGAELRLDLLPQMGLVGVAYVLCRSAGKVVGCRVGASIAKESRSLRTWLGPAMLAQGGLAIGLAGTLSRTWGAEGRAVETAILAAVVVFESVGPLLTRASLIRAGEVTLVSLLSQRPAVSYAEGIHQVVAHFRDALRVPGGHRLEGPADVMVAHVMRRAVEAVHADIPFEEVLHALGRTRYDRLPVVDDEGHLVGVIRYQDVSELLFDPDLRDLVVASDMASEAGVVLKSTETLEAALDALRAHQDQTTLLVVDDADQRRPVGVLRHNDVLAAYRVPRSRARHSKPGQPR